MTDLLSLEELESYTYSPLDENILIDPEEETEEEKRLREEEEERLRQEEEKLQQEKEKRTFCLRR